jgi:hypothetical protein
VLDEVDRSGALAHGDRQLLGDGTGICSIALLEKALETRRRRNLLCSGGSANRMDAAPPGSGVIRASQLATTLNDWANRSASSRDSAVSTGRSTRRQVPSGVVATWPPGRRCTTMVSSVLRR